MGLDVYLYHSTSDRKKVKESKEKYEKGSDENWGKKKYEDMTKKEKDTASEKNRKLALSLGLTEDGKDKNEKQIEIDSKKYPEHYFKVGYFWSSYNDGGINSVLRNAIGKDLYDIFPHEDNEYELYPDWEKSKKLTQGILKEFKDYIAKTGGVKVSKFSYNEFNGLPKNYPVKDENDAMQVYLEEVAKKSGKDSGGFSSYSNGKGEFYLDKPLQVVGIVSGVNKRFFADEYLPCTYLVYKTDDGLDWYVEALEIVIETIDYVLAQKDKKKYYFHWSG